MNSYIHILIGIRKVMSENRRCVNCQARRIKTNLHFGGVCKICVQKMSDQEFLRLVEY